MHCNITALKPIVKSCLIIAILLATVSLEAQIINQKDPNPAADPMASPSLNQNIQQNQNIPLEQRDSVINPTAPVVTTMPQESALDSLEKESNFDRYKVDGVVSVVGKYVILKSDIDKFRIDVEQRFPDNKDVSDCEIVGNMMENKLLSHAALQDSTVFQMVQDAQIEGQVEQQLAQLEEHLGSMSKVLEYYRKDSEDEIREELFEVNKENQLAQAMQEHITDEIEITPEEVKTFFDDIPKDERPTFNDEVELSQIVIKPKTPQKEIDKVVDQLNQMRDEILEGASFATKAVLYSQDGTSASGGKMTITRKDPLDKDFKEIAFSLREGEVSKPFKSSFGYHIVQVDRVLGQQRMIRHIILIPKETKESLEEAKAKADSVRTLIEDKKYTFAEAALRFSDEEKTRGDGGRLINPETGDGRFEMTDIDPRIYNDIKRLKEGEISKPLVDQTRTGQQYYTLYKKTHFYPEHVADYSKDYTRIKDLALQNKQIKAIREWRKKEIEETFVKISEDYTDCDFDENWLKQ